MFNRLTCRVKTTWNYEASTNGWVDKKFQLIHFLLGVHLPSTDRRNFELILLFHEIIPLRSRHESKTSRATVILIIREQKHTEEKLNIIVEPKFIIIDDSPIAFLCKLFIRYPLIFNRLPLALIIRSIYVSREPHEWGTEWTVLCSQTNI